MSDFSNLEAVIPPDDNLESVSPHAGILSPAEEHQARVEALAPVAEADIAKKQAATSATLASRFSVAKPAGQGSVQSLNLSDIPVAGPLVEKGISSLASQADAGSSMANWWTSGHMGEFGDTEDERYRNGLAYQEAYRNAQYEANPTQYYGARAEAFLPQLALTPELKVGQLVGSIGTHVLAPVAENMPGVIEGALKLLGRPVPAAVEAGVWGGAQKAAESAPGSTAQDVGENAIQGGKTGAELGYIIGLPVSTALGVGKWVADKTKVLWNPEGYAADQASKAFNEATSRERAAGLSPEQAQDLALQGKPVTPLDIAGGRSLGEATAGATTGSDPDLIALNQSLSDRFQARSQNVQNDLHAAIPRPNDPQTGRPMNDEQLRSLAHDQAREANSPAYDSAFANPEGDFIWNDDLRRLVNTPGGSAALQKTIGSSNVEATVNRQNPVNPFYKDAGGQWDLNPDVGTPNLQFWDRFKRNMNDVAEAQKGANGAATEESRDTNRLLYNNPEGNSSGTDIAPDGGGKFALVPYLRNLVPEYGTALDGARQYIREDNAFDAGKNFFGTANVAKLSKDPLAADAALRDFSNYTPGEQDTFRHGLLANITDNPEQAAKVFAGGDAKTLDRYRQVLGPDLFQTVDDTLRMHRIAAAGDVLSGKSGNTPTAFQQAVTHAIGYTGGAITLALKSPEILQYALQHPVGTAVTAAVGAAAATGNAVKAAVEKGIGDKKVGAILQMLGSNDPQTFQRIIEAGKSDKQVSDALKRIEYGVTRYAAEHPKDVQPQVQNAQQAATPVIQKAIQQAAPQQASGGRIGRKSGGRTTGAAKAKADQLIAMVDRIKKDEGKGTKPLLNVDDTTIAKALEIANRGI